jgi:hypothetical protein
MSIVSYYGKSDMSRHGRKLAFTMATVATTVISASAGVAEDLTNFSQIIGNSTTGFTAFFTNMLSVFMQPPLLYFVVLGFFVTFIHLAAGFLMKRGKK